MADLSDATRDDVEQLAEVFMADYRAGRSPNLEEYALEYPHLAGDLRDLLMALLLLEQNVPHRRDDNDSTEILSRSAATPKEIGDFAIVREIGRGGMGVVYEAVQQSLGRHVALKVLSTPSLLAPIHFERFRLEARAAARLHHTHIVPVFGVGEHNGLHYYVMQFIQGQTLEMVIEALRSLRRRESPSSSRPQPSQLSQALAGGLLTGEFHRGDAPMASAGEVQDEPLRTSVPQSTADGSPSKFTSSQNGREYYRSVARVGLHVAEALSYAHSEGILHRDIKPSNLLFDAKGNVWVTDFGLARDESSEGLTQTGDFVGTLRYMAPERLEGWSDRRSDVYSLGATLYEMLSLRPFLESAGRSQLLDKILHATPPPLSQSDRLIPRDLETIVLKAVAKEPAARYRTAGEMAEDLERFLADRSILARRSTPAETFVRWCRRNPVIAGLSATTALLLITSVVVLSVSNARIRREATQKEIALQETNIAIEHKDAAIQQKDAASQEKDAALDLARRNEELASGRFYAAQMNLAWQAWKDGHQARAVELLETLRPRHDETDIRGFEWYHLYHRTHANVVDSWQGHVSPVLAAVWDPNGRWFATAQDGEVRFWDGRTGEPRGSIATSERWFWDLDVSHNGRLLVGVASKGEIFVWDTVTKVTLRSWMAHPVDDGARTVAISPDGQLVATGAVKKLENGDEVGDLLLWNLEGELLSTLAGHPEMVATVGFSPDGKMLASATPDWAVTRNILLWDVTETPFKIGEIANIGAYELAFSADGETLWGCGGNRPGEGRTIVEIDTASASLRSFLSAHTDRMSGITRLRGDEQLVTGAGDRTVQLWDLTGNTSETIGAALAPVTAVAADPSGRYVVSGDNNGSITLRDLQAAPAVATFPGSRLAHSDSRRLKLAYTPGGRELFVGARPLHVLDASSLTLKQLIGDGTIIAISSECDLVAAQTGDGVIEVWDTRKQQRISTSRTVDFASCASFSTDGKFLATAYGYSTRSRFDVWDTGSGALIDGIDTDGFVTHSIAFAPNSAILAAGVGFSTVIIYDVANRHEVDRETASGPMVVALPLTYSPDGSLLAAGFSDGSLRLLDADTATGRVELRAQLHGHTLGLSSVAFSPDQRTLASASYDGTVRLWDIPLAQERISLDIEASALAFSPNGGSLAVARVDNDIMVLKGSDLPAAHAMRTWRGASDADSPFTLWREAISSWNNDDVVAAEVKFCGAIEQFESDLGAEARNFDYRSAIRCYKHFAELLKRTDRLSEAAEAFDRTKSLVEQYALANPDSAEAQELRLDIVAQADRAEVEHLASQGKWSEAIQRALQAVDHHPDDAYSWYTLCVLRLKSGDIANYRTACQHIERHFGNTTNPHAARCRNWAYVIGPEACSDFRLPLERLEQLVALPTSDADATGALGAMLYRAGAYAEASAQLNSALERLAREPSETTTDLYPWLFLAMSELQLGNVGEARSIWEDLQPEIERELALDPPWNRRVTLELLNEEATALMGIPSDQRVKREAPASPDTEGLAIRRRRLSHAAALRALTEAIGKNPTDRDLWLGRAEIYVSIPDWDLATADYLEAINQTSDSFSWCSPRKELCRMLAGDLNIYPRLLTSAPNESALWIGKAQHQVLRSNWTAAAEAYARGFEYSTLTDDCTFEYAGALLLAGNRDEYLTLCDRLQRHCDAPHDPLAAFTAARTCTLCEAGSVDPLRLVELAKERLEHDDQPWNIHIVGVAYYRAGQYVQGIEHLLRSNATDWGEQSKSMNDFVLAMAYHRSGQFESADKQLQSGLDRMQLASPKSRGEAAAVAVPDWIEMSVLGAEAATLLAPE